jgi:hypothetical protein
VPYVGGERGADEGYAGKGGQPGVSPTTVLLGQVWNTYASSTTPIRKLVAVPNRPMDHVAIGETRKAAQTTYQQVSSDHGKGVTYIWRWTTRPQRRNPGGRHRQ